jgi:Phosphatidylethanolamine-binding protein
MCKARLRRYCSVLGATALALLLSATGALAFSVSFAWCSGSPRFALTDVPSGTAKLDFHMTDLNKPSFHHGGGTVDYRGQAEVPCGAFAKGFVGPSPPPGEVHTYEFTIKALGANGAPLATTAARRKFASKSLSRPCTAAYVAFHCHD